MTKLDEIAARHAVASPGDWYAATGHIGVVGSKYVIDIQTHSLNMNFIAHAHQDVPFLLDLATTQGAEIERLRGLLIRSRDEIADELASMIDSYRGLFPARQTDAEVLADADHEKIDNPAYEAMKRWTALIGEIDAALGVRS